MQVHSMKHLFPLKLSLSVGGEDQVPALPSSAGASADNLAPIPPQTLPSDKEVVV